MTNKHQDRGQDVLDLFGQCLLGNANRGKLILENVTLRFVFLLQSASALPDFRILK